MCSGGECEYECVNDSLCVCVCECGGGELLQVAPKLFTSHSKLFKAWQLCFFWRDPAGGRGGRWQPGEEGGRGRGGEDQD